MSNVIDFLERFGGDAQLRHASEDELEVALKLAGIEPELQAAIASKDQSELERLLGASTNVCCMVNKPDDEEEEEEDKEDDEDEDEDDEDDDFDEDEDEEDDEDEDEDEDEDDVENVSTVDPVTDRAA